MRFHKIAEERSLKYFCCQARFGQSTGPTSIGWSSFIMEKRIHTEEIVQSAQVVILIALVLILNGLRRVRLTTHNLGSPFSHHYRPIHHRNYSFTTTAGTMMSISLELHL